MSLELIEESWSGHGKAVDRAVRFVGPFIMKVTLYKVTVFQLILAMVTRFFESISRISLVLCDPLILCV